MGLKRNEIKRWTDSPYIQGGARNVIPLIVHVTHFYYYQTFDIWYRIKGWKIVPNEEHVQCDHHFASQPLAFITAFWHKSSESARHNFTMWALSCATFPGLLEARQCSAAKRWSHWTRSSLGTIYQLMRINSVPDVKCFCNNKNLLCAQSMVWHFVRHPVFAARNTYLGLL